MKEENSLRDNQVGLSSILYEQGNGLDRLAHTHFIRKHAATPFPFFLLAHPRQAFELEREELNLFRISYLIFISNLEKRSGRGDNYLQFFWLHAFFWFDDLPFF